MVELRILTVSKAGGDHAVRRFPFHVGRAADNDLSLDAAGVWNYHFALDFRPGEGVVLQAFDEAFVAVNEQPQRSVRLHNGDLISFGSVKAQFWLSASVQRGLGLREFLVWFLVLLVTLGQVGLLYCLLQG